MDPTVETILTSGGLALASVSLVMLWYQTKQVAKTLRTQVSSSLSEQCLELSRMNLEFPTYAPYTIVGIEGLESLETLLANWKLDPQRHEEYCKAIALFEAHADFLVNITLQLNGLPKSHRDEWRNYRNQNVESPAVKYLRKSYPKWYECFEKSAKECKPDTRPVWIRWIACPYCCDRHDPRH